MSGCLINTEHISTYFGKGQGTYPITTKVYMWARPTIQVWQKTPSFIKIDVVANQSDQLPILRRKMRSPYVILNFRPLKIYLPDTLSNQKCYEYWWYLLAFHTSQWFVCYGSAARRRVLETWKLSSPSRVSSQKMSRLFPTTVYYVLKPPTWVLDAIHYHLYLMYGNKLHNSPLRFTQPKSTVESWFSKVFGRHQNLY